MARVSIRINLTSCKGWLDALSRLYAGDTFERLALKLFSDARECSKAIMVEH